MSPALRKRTFAPGRPAQPVLMALVQGSGFASGSSRIAGSLLALELLWLLVWPPTLVELQPPVEALPREGDVLGQRMRARPFLQPSPAFLEPVQVRSTPPGAALK